MLNTAGVSPSEDARFALTCMMLISKFARAVLRGRCVLLTFCCSVFKVHVCAAICVCVARCCLATFIILKHVYTPVNTFSFFSFSSFSFRLSFFALLSLIAPKTLRHLHFSSLVSAAPAASRPQEIRVGKFRVLLAPIFYRQMLSPASSKKADRISQ